MPSQDDTAGAARAAGAPKMILLRAGLHYLTETLALDTRDAGLAIQNYAGEAAWTSGGVPLATKWTRYHSGSAPVPPPIAVNLPHTGRIPWSPHCTC